MISQFFGKFVKVWNREIFDFVAFAKLIPAKMFSSSDLEVISGENYFFLKKLIIIVYVLINTFLIKLIFYPLKQPRKKKYLRKVNRQKLHKKLGNWTVSQTLF